MIRHFAYINDSTGELDWLAPYLKEVAARKERTSVCVALPRLSLKAKLAVFGDYFNNTNVEQFTLSNWSHQVLRFEFFLERAAAKIAFIRKVKLKVNKFLSHVLSYFIFQKTPPVKFLYLDYNLKEKALFLKIRRHSPSAKIVVFPHSTALMTSTLDTPKPPPALIDCDLFLECTKYHTRFSAYDDKIAVVGSPALDRFRNQSREIDKTKAVLFLTRRNSPEFAMDEIGTLERFKKLIRWCSANNFNIHVKHHPRDTQLDKWQNLYGDCQVTEVESNIEKLTTDYRIVFGTYTSAVVLFAAKGIPTFDFTSYTGNTDRLSYHYLDETNQITHELIDLGITKRMDRADFLNLSVLSSEDLKELGYSQKNIVDQIFPSNSLERIIHEINKIDD